MITLNTQRITEVLRKQIANFFEAEPVLLELTQDIYNGHDAADERMLHFSNPHYWVKVMDCAFESYVRPVILCEVIYFLKKEYMDAEVEVNVDIDLSPDAQERISITASISFNDQVELERSELNNLIDLALQLKDKAWFEELSCRYNAISA
ncbi:IDEAL domain-containing protein [Saccharibacillus sp. CPCC 101409]|uniref:IDEAL domain-containing protein n=1 Tax=Saccharibacillus sp. CPCC 101409 TaxID=3058041 RepID=UPI002673B0B5|nr:IDEAL domain-containing protein [Saccharibacillus sp. CPCC 101409]MDO3411405.1 IDEAL domain-containing protein [Saccharibacillus sp. CPCC 101409]